MNKSDSSLPCGKQKYLFWRNKKTHMTLSLKKINILSLDATQSGSPLIPQGWQWKKSSRFEWITLWSLRLKKEQRLCSGLAFFIIIFLFIQWLWNRFQQQECAWSAWCCVQGFAWAVTNLRAELVLSAALQSLSQIYAYSSCKDLMHVLFGTVFCFCFEQEVEMPTFWKEVAGMMRGQILLEKNWHVAKTYTHRHLEFHLAAN